MNKDDFIRKVLRDGWNWNKKTKDKIDIFTKSERFTVQHPDSPMLYHYAFYNYDENYWKNYCSFNGDEKALYRFLKIFRLEFLESMSWRENIKRMENAGILKK